MSFEPAALPSFSLLAPLSDGDRAAVVALLERVEVPEHGVVVRQGEPGADSMYFVVEGSLRAVRGGMTIQFLGPGDHFGELGMMTGRTRRATLEALTPVVLGVLHQERFEELAKAEPLLAQQVLRAVIGGLGERLTALTDGVGALLRERTMPRSRTVRLRLNGEEKDVPPGTRPVDLLPREAGGAPIVAATFDNRPVALDAPLFTDGRLAPVTLLGWDGRDVYRRSLSLAVLECGRRAAPGRNLQVGQSLGSAQRILVEGNDDDLPALAERLSAVLEEVVGADLPFFEELWSVEEAQTYFREKGPDAIARLLLIWRNPTVRIARFGDTVTLHSGVLVPSAGYLKPGRIIASSGALLLDFGEHLARFMPKAEERVIDPVELERVAPRYATPMVREHGAWLKRFGLTNVGAYNELCVRRHASELIRVSEGFHEKSIGRIADRIAEAKDRVRIIAVAGPSSSGKTTFIKRLTTQLQINGILPEGVSLDDYYKDRAQVPLDENGEKDFEAFEAIRADLVRDHVRRLLEGDLVKTAKYDFFTGSSLPDGGRGFSLPKGHVLLVEGIHGLNPQLFEGVVGDAAVFRVFVHPATTLPFDRLSFVSSSDVRLLRRIVRDRHQRGFDAADTIRRWPSVRRGERLHIFPYLGHADAVFDSALVYETSVLKVFAEQYLLEVKQSDAVYMTAYRLRHLIDRFVALHPDHVPPTSLLREFIGGSGFEY